MVADTNSIIREYLVNQTALTAIVGTRIVSPRLPENETLPAISFFTRGGPSTPYIPGMPEPSVQFDCWDDDPIDARTVYRTLYDALQGIQRQVVSLSGTDYIIWSAVEEVQGQDIPDVDIQGYFKTMTFFKFVIKAE